MPFRSFMHSITCRTICLLTGLTVALSLGGCSGGFPALAPSGYVVQPGDLRQFISGGSLSTLWYRGSDTRYHYFSHMVKVSTNYRVKRSDLKLSDDDEFQIGTKESALVARFRNPSIVEALNEPRQGEQDGESGG